MCIHAVITTRNSDHTAAASSPLQGTVTVSFWMQRFQLVSIEVTGSVSNQLVEVIPFDRTVPLLLLQCSRCGMPFVAALFARSKRWRRSIIYKLDREIIIASPCTDKVTTLLYRVRVCYAISLRSGQGQRSMGL